ncbi:hypothetical protein APHAL10511_002714 [Amanita phalloides]|nr:hypothetical protein APHAL10511_002714 [Amanita phalloides]
MSVVEIHRFLASDAFIADQSIAKQLLDILKGIKGQIRRYYGLQVEDNKTGFLVLVWESYEDFADIKNNPSYSAIIEVFKTLHMEGPQSQIHVLFNGDTTPVFNAPVTEFTFANAKEGVVSTIEERKKGFDAILTKLKPAQGLHGVVSGEIRGDPDTLSAVLGWDSVDAHIQAITAEELKPALDNFMRIAVPVTPHAKLTRHE